MLGYGSEVPQSHIDAELAAYVALGNHQDNKKLKPKPEEEYVIEYPENEDVELLEDLDEYF